ncbi:MAG: bifunctional nuclease domain-containing protein [Candidatus Dormibacteria bacterium]
MSEHVERADLLPIGRFSKRANLSVQQLRYYHELRILEPARVDAESGYRYYSMLQVQAADLIAVLRSLDVPLTDIRSLLRDPSEPNVKAVLEGHRRNLESRFAEARQKLKAIDAFLKEGQLKMRLEEPKDLVAIRVDSVRVHQPSGQHVLILADDAGERRLPIWIGPYEANSIALKLSGETVARPLTHDLFITSLEVSGAKPQRVVIWYSETAEVYSAALHLSVGKNTHVIDCRPSDGVALAVRCGAEVLVSRATLERSSVPTGIEPSGDSIGAFTVKVALAANELLGTLVSAREPIEGDRVWVGQEFEVMSGGSEAGAISVRPASGSPGGRSALWLLPPPTPSEAKTATD